MGKTTPAQRDTRQSSKDAQPQQTQTQSGPSSIAQMATPRPNSNKLKRQHFAKAIRRHQAKVNAEGFINLTLFELEEMLTTLSDDWNAYKEEYSKIFDDLLEEPESNECEAVFVETEQIQMQVRSKIRERLSHLTPKPAQAVSQDNAQNRSLTVTMPDALANIPNSWGYFSGDYADWPAFRDRYKSRMHDRTDVLITHKWGYLRSSLSGDALRALGKWADTDENYELAWNRLCSQYNDDYIAVQSLIQKLLKVQKMGRSCSKGLRNILDTVHECLSQLGTYVSTKSWDPLIIFLVIDKLDDATRIEWEKHRHANANTFSALTTGDDDTSSQQSDAAGGVSLLPTWKEMEAFLNQQSKILRDMAQHQPLNARVDSKNANRNQPQNATQKVPYANENLPPCLLCRAKHPHFSCTIWRGMSVDERFEFQKANKLCVICVQSAHGKDPCWGKPDFPKPCKACSRAGEKNVSQQYALLSL